MFNKRFIIFIVITSIIIISILGVVILALLRHPKITSFSPSKDSRDNSIYSLISISFDKPLTSTDINTFKIEADPKIDGKLSRSQDSKILYFRSDTPLLINQEYTIKVSFYKEDTSWNFATVTLDTLTPQDQAKAQTQADSNFTQITQDLFNTYPWYNSLPIQTSAYFVFFDLDKKEFEATIFSTSQGINTEAKIQATKNEILNKLKALNVDTSQYKINWIIK